MTVQTHRSMALRDGENQRKERQAFLIPALGEAVAQVLSIVILLTVILTAVWLLVRGRGRALPPTTLLAIGAAWAVGTVLFEAWFNCGDRVPQARAPPAPRA